MGKLIITLRDGECFWLADGTQIQAIRNGSNRVKVVLDGPAGVQKDAGRIRVGHSGARFGQDLGHGRTFTDDD